MDNQLIINGLSKFIRSVPHTKMLTVFSQFGVVYFCYLLELQEVIDEILPDGIASVYDSESSSSLICRGGSIRDSLSRKVVLGIFSNLAAFT